MWVAGVVAVGAAAAIGIIAASPAHATDSEPCVEGDVTVTESGVGTGIYEATITNPDAATECGVWLQTFTFDDDYVPVDASDYGHPQTAREWAWVVLTPTPQTLTAIIPECGPYQTDVSVGELQLNLPNGDLGANWVAGSVGVRPLCTAVESPTEATPPTTEAAPPIDVTVSDPAVPDTAPPAVVAEVTPPPAELASTGFEPWMLAPGIGLIVFGSALFITSRRAHQ
jgi:hypothetical protein